MLGFWNGGPSRVLRRLPVRLKLVVVLALPGAVLLLLTGANLADARASADRAEVQADLALATAGPRGLVRNLQIERNWSTATLMGTEAALDLPYDSFEQARSAVDDALAEFGPQVEGSSAQVRDAYGPAVAALDGLADLRASVDAEPAGDGDNYNFSAEVFAGYTALIDQLVSAGEQVSVDVDDPDLRHGADIVNLSTRQLDDNARLIRALVSPDLNEGQSPAASQEARSNVEELLAVMRTRRQAIELDGKGPYQDMVEQALANENLTAVFDMAEDTLATGRTNVRAALDISAPDGYGYDELLDDAADVVADEAASSTSAAAATQRNYTLLGLVVLTLMVGLAWLVTRSITSPLRSLTDQAKRMADEDLPQAVSTILATPLGADVLMPPKPRVEVATRDEVGDVAAALNTVQDAAVSLAMEQAVLRRNVAESLVNLGRRNHDLLVRQIAFITELERDETDAESLASLFRLDHMATRMRRNAESLLVLAGMDLPRLWTTPVKVLDVVRAALGEVEGYQRVAVRINDASAVEGTAASGLAHLLAELIENALVFSPSSSVVETDGWLRPDGYIVTVTDAGPGMDPESLERANRRLADAEPFTLAPSRFLGHYVAGQLASRHGIDVWLESPANGRPAGTTAVVRVPTSLVVGSPEGGWREPDALAAAPLQAAIPAPATPQGQPHHIRPL
jgi:signal transduction histidine kinase